MSTPATEVIDLSQFIDPEHYDRSQFVGSSDLPAILGVSPYRSRLDAFLDKTQPQTRPDVDSVPMRRGRILEPYVAELIRAEVGLELAHRNRRFRDSVTPYFAAEIDAEYADEAGALQNVEIKTVSPWLAAEWGEPGSDIVPVSYLVQMQWGLAVTGRQTCRLFALIGFDDLRSYSFERDEALITEMRRMAREFWQVYVRTNSPPPLDAEHGGVWATIKRLFPGTNGQTVRASAMQETYYRAMADAAEKAGMYQGLADAAKAHLTYEMGETAQLAFADGKALKRSQRARKGYAVDATEYMDVRIGKAGKTDDKPEQTA
jgi:putative phage-type endonuclease